MDPRQPLTPQLLQKSLMLSASAAWHRNRAPERNPRKEEGGCVDELWESRLMHRNETALGGGGGGENEEDVLYSRT